MDKLFAAVVQYALRMPLDSDDGRRCMHNTFDYIIPGSAYGSQITSKMIYRLVVGGIDKCGGAVQLIEEIIAVQPAVIDMVLLILSLPFMGVGGIDMLIDCAAQMNID